MTGGRVERPDFRTASEEEIAEYHRRCLFFGEDQGIDDAERELRKRGKGERADYLRKARP